MADPKQLKLLRANINKWNNWRERYQGIIDLREADLSGANLSRANLRIVDLSNADLSGANLTDANLLRTDLSGANLTVANLSRADLSNATMGWTTFGAQDLRQVKGLETIQHIGPSDLSINTIYQSEGDFPEAFVRGTGAPDSFLEYIHALASKPIQYYTCFVSYSSKDQEFAERIYADLQSKGVRCWYAPEDLKIGEKFWHRIDESIRLYDKLLVILSHHSVQSEWVEREATAALEKEKRQQTLVLFPISVDEAFKDTLTPWASDVRRNRHIGDFRHWKDHDQYQKAFQRLLRDLKAESSKLRE
jgi:uncharacterized protein YjbI with pentapeptide repeats